MTTEMIRPEGVEAKPVVKFVGGKRQLLPEILRYVPRDFGAYHEPFVGGGAVFFALSSLGLLKEQSTLSDTNAKLVMMYQALRDDVEEVIGHLKKHENKESRYYAVRADNMLVGSKARRAADLLFLNRCGFNGLYRENKKGQFNVPFGDNPKATICDEEKLRAASRALAKASIVEADFERVRAHVYPNDLVYLDSPYAPLSKTSDFTGYQAAGFSVEDHRRLAAFARELIDARVSVILSASSAELTRELYEGLPIIDVLAKRSVNSKKDKRGVVKEVLVVSPWLVRQMDLPFEEVKP